MKQVYDKSVEEALKYIKDKAKVDVFEHNTGEEPLHEVVYSVDEEVIWKGLRQLKLALIDAEIERLEGMKDSEGYNAEENRDTLIGRGYNQAIDDHLTHLKEQRETISNS